MNPSSPTPPFRLRPFRLRHLAATTLLSLTLQTALAQTSTFDLPAQPLAQALAQFARQAGVQLAASPDLLQGLQGRAVNGTLEIKAALDELLRGTGLHGRMTDGVLTIERAPLERLPLRSDRAATLPTVNVKGSAEESPTGPVSGYVARRSASGTKTNTPLLETPQSISVVGQEEISSRGAQDMEQALAYSPGVISESFGPVGLFTDYVLVRGFVAPVFLDGTQVPNFNGKNAGWASETWGLERIETLKGPASALYGQGAPGGLLNLASKRPIGPTTTPYHAAQFTVGSFNRRQAAVDLSGPIGGDAQVAYRLVALARKSDDQFDFNKHERQYIAPSLAWTLSPDTRLTFLANYLRENGSGNHGPLPLEGTLLPNPNGPLPRNRTASEPTEQSQRRQYAVGYELEHRFNEQWSFQQKLRHTNMQLKKNDFSYNAWLRDFNGIPVDYQTVHRDMTSMPGEHRVLTLDNSLQADFNTGSIQHKALAGIDFQRARGSYQLSSTILPNLNLYAPVYGAPYGPPDLQWGESARSDQVGLYLQDQMKIERLLVTMSGRYDRVKSSAYRNDLSAPTLLDQTDHKLTGRLGINYLLDNGFSPYASYSTSFQPTLGVGLNGQVFKPTSAEQFEAGLKYQPDYSRISATISAFHLTQRNILTSALVLPLALQTQTGEVQVDGLELETKANLGSGLGLTLAAAWLNPKITSNIDDTVGNRLGLTPKVQASAWLSYRLPVGLTLGLGARHIGSIYGDNINSVLAPAYTLIDTSVQYELGRLSTSLAGAKLGLSMNNVADKTYFIGCSVGNCYYGAERTANLTLNYEW